MNLIPWPLMLACGLMAVHCRPASAGPFVPEEISAEAKWMLHLDLDQLRSTALGSFLVRETEKRLDVAKGSLPFNLDLTFRSIRSVTAYGETYDADAEANGVLLLKMDVPAQEALVTLAQSFLASATNAPIKKTERNASVLYSIDDELFAGVAQPGTFIAGKSRGELEKAIARLRKTEPKAGPDGAFRGFPEAPKSFFFLGLAEGFNEAAAIPPQARVLQMADGGRLVLGESGENMFLNMVLKTKSPEVGAQVQQVIQGMIALLTLSQMENRELMQLAQSTKITAHEKTVSIHLEYPVAKALDRISQLAADLRSKWAAPTGAPSQEADGRNDQRTAPSSERDSVVEPERSKQ